MFRHAALRSLRVLPYSPSRPAQGTLLNRALSNGVKQSPATPFARIGKAQATLLLVVGSIGLGVGVNIGIEHSERVKYEREIAAQAKEITEKLWSAKRLRVIGWCAIEADNSPESDSFKLSLPLMKTTKDVPYSSDIFTAARYLLTGSGVLCPVVTGNIDAQQSKVEKRIGEVVVPPKNGEPVLRLGVSSSVVTQRGLQTDLKEGGVRVLSDSNFSVKWEAPTKLVDRLFSSLSL